MSEGGNQQSSLPPPFRVLALIYPIERHIGHWACSSPSIDLLRVIMEGDELPRRVREAVLQHRPQAIAIIGKRVGEYHDLLDELARELPSLRDVPRIYRCQNTVFAHRVAGQEDPSRSTLAGMDAWFARACDPRFSLVLVQTLDDVPLIRKALQPVQVEPCPYGYDVEIFDPSLPELDRVTDVGCYFNLRDDERRVRLVEFTEALCARRGWSFRFVAGKYWHDYATQIRTTKVCLHLSDQQEVPYRMYETTVLGSLFLTDPLRYSVDKFFTHGTEYLTFQPDLSDLEQVLGRVLEDRALWNRIRTAGKQRASQYRWSDVAESYVVPALKTLLGSKAG